MKTRSASATESYNDALQMNEFNNIPNSAIQEEESEAARTAYATNVTNYDSEAMSGKPSLLQVSRRVPSKGSRKCNEVLNSVDPCDSPKNDSSENEPSYADSHVEMEQDHDDDENDTYVDGIEANYKADDSDDEASANHDVTESSDDNDHEELSFLEEGGYDTAEYEARNSPSNRGGNTKKANKNYLDEFGSPIKGTSLRGVKSSALSARRGGRALRNGVKSGAHTLKRHARAASEIARRQTKSAINSLKEGIRKTGESLNKKVDYVKSLAEGSDPRQARTMPTGPNTRRPHKRTHRA
ncbi:hypothetical protein X943_000106 [Babesia divergens]|uniref:Uncharacterized protein n=1 Tax=Babesia divergens TaxID=32595 RepID=A0AAD9GA84_BABDI|nr:hypothetical protein X943_000106 [Babesia divergens]